MATERTETLLDRSGTWTHRDSHQHHRFEIWVPDRTVELRVHLRWGPHDLGSEHAANSVGLSLFDADGFRGTPTKSGDEQLIVIGETEATLGALAGPLAPGPWTVNVDTGVILNDGAETGFVSYELVATATTGRPAGSGIAAAPVPGSRLAAGGERWYRGDLHAHTVHSDGEVTVAERAQRALDHGLDFLAITDHNTTSHLREAASWPEGITPIRGSEITTFYGHINGLGLSAPIDWRDQRRGGGPASIVEAAHRQGALVSINHPMAYGDPWCGACRWEYASADYATIDAMEVWNAHWALAESDNEGALAFWTDLLDAGYRITAISGTDSHAAEDDAAPGAASTYVRAGDPSERSILDGIRLGRVFLSAGPIVTFRATGSDGVEIRMPGMELPADGAFRLAIDVERLEQPATLWYATSGSIRPLATCDPGPSRVDERPMTAERWWRLELRQGTQPNGDLLALTNPVYVKAG